MQSPLRTLRRWLKHIVIHEARHIIVAPVLPRETGMQANVDDARSECLIVESVSELEAIARQIPPGFSYDKLRKAAEGSFLAMIVRPTADGRGRQVIGYRICERGVFSSLGMRKRISPDFVFVHYAEVLPEYRGRRIATQLKECLHRHCRARNIRWTCGAVNVTNAASLAAHLRAREGVSAKIVARIDKLTFLGGRYVWTTPWSRIQHALDTLCATPPAPDEAPGSARSAAGKGSSETRFS